RRPPPRRLKSSSGPPSSERLSIPVRQPTSQGNIEGTPAPARASTRGHSSTGDSFFLRDFRARGFPAVPAVPASLLDGKEGVDGSSPSEGSAKAPHVGASSFRPTC